MVSPCFILFDGQIPANLCVARVAFVASAVVFACIFVEIVAFVATMAESLENKGPGCCGFWVPEPLGDTRNKGEKPCCVR